MPQLSTLTYVADLVIRRTLTEVEDNPSQDLAEILEQAYPFEQSPAARRIWVDALLRNAVRCPPILRDSLKS